MIGSPFVHDSFLYHYSRHIVRRCLHAANHPCPEGGLHEICVCIRHTVLWDHHPLHSANTTILLLCNTIIVSCLYASRYSLTSQLLLLLLPTLLLPFRLLQSSSSSLFCTSVNAASPWEKQHRHSSSTVLPLPVQQTLAPTSTVLLRQQL